MAVTFNAADRYYNPVSFRTLLPPAVTRFDEVRALSVRFLTDRKVLQDLLPEFFELPAEPIITVAHAHNIGVDWLGGRTYYIARIETQVTYRGQEETVTGPFSMVVWESDAKPVIVGRELQGYQKIVGNLGAHSLTETSGSFECLEYDTRLFRGELQDLKPVPDSTFEKMRGDLDKNGHIALGWKYIPNPDGGADVNYATRLPMRGTLAEVRQGTGTIEFDSPEWAAAPGSAHIIAALKTLPVLEYRSALLTRMIDVTLPRDQVRRII